MSDTVIRPAVPADRESMAEVYRSCHPALLVSAASIAHASVAYGDEGIAEFVAEREGRVVGVASSWRDPWSPEEGAAALDVAVRPESRRRGVGALLMARAEQHHAEIGGRVARGNAAEEAGLAFAAKHGFATGRIARVSRCSLDELPARVEAPADVEVVSLSSVEDLRVLYETDSLAARDIPGDHPIVPFSFEHWKARLLDDPRLDHELSTICVVEGTVTAMAYLQRVGDRVHSSYTGAHPGFRGRGHATLVKSHALHAARSAGATEAFTSNDATNAPMLAVNARLGYRPFLERTALRREKG
ncbi:GNAT family N-acetyltransferase [Phytomonospora sp. NPDC050363]|uniref:GNAT family N-acetyltransferase n=1 Tax=Phytomonospora sp. NPDC050363 TaxID=3155642 RepID=UPI0033DD5BE0